MFQQTIHDTLVLGKKDAVLAFHDAWNPIDLEMSFTIETEGNE